MDPKNFGSIIQLIISGNDISKELSYEMFKDVLLNVQTDLQQGAFLGALVTKGETVDELYGAWKAIYELDTIKVNTKLPDIIVDNSGTGMDGVHTFNVSTASAIVAASLGVPMARHGARALSSKCGTVDICEALGINVELSVDEVARCICEIGIGLFNGMSPKTHPQALFRILSGIHFGSTLNISASLASPIIPTYAVRGVYSEDIIKKVGTLMKMIGIKRGIVVNGFADKFFRGMDEVSPVGETAVYEFNEEKEEFYYINSHDFISKKIDINDILYTGSLSEEAKRFINVLQGKYHEPCILFTALNTAPILYITGKAKDYVEGFNMALDAIYSGMAYQKYLSWKEFSNL